MAIDYYVYKLRIELPNMTVFKLGNSTNINKRIASLGSIEKPSSVVKGLGLPKPYITCIGFKAFDSLSKAEKLETVLLAKYKEFKYTGRYILANGNTELLTIEPDLFI